MKSVLVLLLMIMMATVAEAQEVKLEKVDTVTSVKDYEMQYLRSCLAQYHKSRRVAYTMAIGSIGATAVAASAGNMPVFYAVGGFLGVAACAQFVIAEKKLFNATIKPSPDKLALTINF